jgi:hypothetical protein
MFLRKALQKEEVHRAISFNLLHKSKVHRNKVHNINKNILIPKVEKVFLKVVKQILL